MTLEQALPPLITVTLVEMMVAIGLGASGGEIAAVARDVPLVLRAFLANYVIVPAVAVGLLVLFDANPMVTAGILIVAACPGAPFGPPLTKLAKGDVGASVGLMVVLAGSSAIVAPALLRLLLPVLAAQPPISIDPAMLVRTLLLTQLLPLAAGLAVRRLWPRVADRASGPAARVAQVLNLATMVGILAAQMHTLLAIRLAGLLGMLALVAASLLAGYLLGGPTTAGRRALSLTTSLRNIGVGLVIATQAFPKSPAVTAALSYGLVGMAGAIAVAWAMGRRSPQAEAAATT